MGQCFNDCMGDESMRKGRWNSYAGGLIHSCTSNIFKTEWPEQPTNFLGTVRKPAYPVLWQFKGATLWPTAGWDGCYHLLKGNLVLQHLASEPPKDAKSTDTPLPSGVQGIATIISKRDRSAESTYCFVWNWERQSSSFKKSVIFFFFFF